MSVEFSDDEFARRVSLAKGLMSESGGFVPNGMFNSKNG